MEAAEDSAAPGPDAPPAVAPAPPERAGAFSTMMDAQKRQKAADAAYAKEPLPKPKPRGPAPKGLDGQPKTWDPPAGPIEQHATHGPGIFTGRWASPTDASPMPAPAPNFRPREGTTWTTPTSASTSPTTSASRSTATRVAGPYVSELIPPLLVVYSDGRPYCTVRWCAVSALSDYERSKPQLL